MTTFILNGWAASPRAWDLCAFARSPETRLFSYLDQLDGRPEAALAERPEEKVLLVGWSMGGSSALRLACRAPARVAGLVLVAATPYMMEDRARGWRGMSERRLEAFRYAMATFKGLGVFGVPEGLPNPYQADTAENLDRGLRYLHDVDLRPGLERVFAAGADFPVHVFHSERDGIVRPENAAYLRQLFPHARVDVIPGAEHALPIFIPGRIDSAVAAVFRRGA